MIIEARRDVITLRGSLTENEWPTIQAAAKLLLEQHPTGIIIDCGGLSEVTEAGAKTFLDAINYIQQYKARIIVAELPENALDVIRRVRAVISQLPIAPTVEDARASLGLDELSAHAGKRELRTIATLLIGDWQRAMNIACRIANRKRDEIRIVGFIKVPRTMPLQTPLPEDEALIRRRIEDSDRIARDYKLVTASHVERVRNEAEGLQRVISSLRPYILVLSVGNLDETTSDLVNQVMPNLLLNPPCEILYDRLPMS